MNRKITMHDELQKYTYECVEPVGKNFSSEFTPDLSPKEMLELGVFGGNYFGRLPNAIEEFPKSWLAHAKITTEKRDAKLNHFRINASQSRGEWQKKGWIYADDPRGWFQWYCRYYMGRRLPKEDARQIRRWHAIGRHIAQIKNNCRAGDESCRPRQRQAVLHWAYNSLRL